MTISKTEMLDELKNQYLYKASFFSRLAACMELSRALIDDPAMLGHEQFPPSDKIINFHSENNMFPTLTVIRVDQDTIRNEDATAVIKYIMSSLKDVQVDQDISFEIIADYCTRMRDLCLRTSIVNTIKCYKLINNINSLGLLITAKAYHLLGYSSAKMEESQRNTKGGGAAKTQICMDNIKELADLILPPDQRDATVTSELPISKAKYDALCKKVLGVVADVTPPTKNKYRKIASEIIGREITFEKKSRR